MALSLDDIKIRQVNILQAVHNFCDTNNLTYSLAYGTLIGAVRHKGYIPWDDDIDICMPRPDYMRFLEIFNSTGGPFQVVAFETDQRFPYAFAKVMDTRTKLEEVTDAPYDLGVNIDVFPIDGVSKTQISLKQQIFYRTLLNIKIITCVAKRSKIKNAILLLGKQLLRPLSVQKLIKIMVKNSQRYPYTHADYISCVALGSKINCPIPKNVFDTVVPIEFEQKTFWAMAGYDVYLTSIYGDYMQLPPVEKRVSHHAFHATIRTQINRDTL